MTSTHSNTMHILVVDDEPDLRELIEYNLTQSGHKVTCAADGIQALELASSIVPDVLVLDVMMPELNGIEVAKRLRNKTETASIPIIMLTAKAEEAHELEGLDAGADDYITKPFSMPVLVARINSLSRRTRMENTMDASITLGPIAINLHEHQVSVAGQPIQLTITEFRLLAALAQSKGKVLSRAELISRAIGPAVTVTPRTVDVHITALRKKLGDHANLISTVRAVGYRADDPSIG
ncbi:MAG: response regulator transcription factor [Phycisphaerales bacterium]|nr:response regulator transcription factor [Phycisphaerales bacterium]